MFPQLFGKYMLERELATGGMARVYLATLRGAVGFEKRLVVKQIRPELASDQAFVQRFVEEAKTAVELSHPNIVPVYELGVERGVYYIAMEFCAGVTLAEILAESGRLSPEEGAYVGVEICRALDYAHRRAGIVHRDVTPRNVLLDEEGAVRLIDFGIALPVARDGRTRSDVFGSPGHMPPEQLAGKPLSPAADVFAVAALLVEAWSGRPPFRRGTPAASEAALHESRPPLSAQVPALAPLEPLIQAALALDPLERPQDAELFARPLRDFLRVVDSGDLARALGAKVRRAREHAARPDDGWGPLDRLEAVEFTPPLPEPGAAMTRTFAQRDEVGAWTPPGPPKESTGNGPITRKLPSVTPASLPPPSAPPPSLPPDAKKTPLRHAGSVLAALTLTAAVVWVARAPGRSKPDAAAPSRPLPARTASASVRPPQPATSAALLPAPEPTPGFARATLASASVGSSSPITASPSAAPHYLTPLRLTADPPARVRIQGAGVTRTLRTPVRELRLPAGLYTVTFESDTYAAPVIARLKLEGETARSVHADFREADPKLTVR